MPPSLCFVQSTCSSTVYSGSVHLVWSSGRGPDAMIRKVFLNEEGAGGKSTTTWALDCLIDSERVSPESVWSTNANSGSSLIAITDSWPIRPMDPLINTRVRLIAGLRVLI